MYIYVFFATPQTPLTLPAGLTAESELISQDGISVLVEPKLTPEHLRDGTDQFQLQAILWHDHVTQMMFQQTTVLPVPFGTFLVSRDALLAHLTNKASDYLQTLTRLQGKAEYTLKLIPVDTEAIAPSIPQEVTGKDYFLAKKQRYQAQSQLKQQQQENFQTLLQAIATTIPDHQHPTPQDGQERIHLLCDRHQSAELEILVQQWQATCPTWTLTLSDPLPPYHFT
jgi:hypothetical protein